MQSRALVSGGARGGRRACVRATRRFISLDTGRATALGTVAARPTGFLARLGNPLQRGKKCFLYGIPAGVLTDPLVRRMLCTWA